MIKKFKRTNTHRLYRPTFLLVGEVEYPVCGLGTEVGAAGGGGGLSAPRSPDWDSAASSTIRSDLLHITMGWWSYTFITDSKLKRRGRLETLSGNII
jgi:hypothetical protein